MILQEVRDVVLDGYAAVRTDDVYEVARLDETSFTMRALAITKERPRVPDVALHDLPGLLASAQRLFPLLVIYTERLDPDVCFVGRIESLGDDDFALHEIDPDAEWIGPETYRYEDVTRVDFGGRYEQALADVSASER